MRRFLTLLVTLVVFGVSTSLAQTKQVSGRVVGADDNQPIIGASVLIKEAPTVGTTTDVNGNYTLKNVPANAKTLVFRFVGYQTLELPLTGSTVSAKLSPDNQKIDEVVVVGYGTQKKKDLAGSVTSVKTGGIDKTPLASFDKAMQGKSSGVQITSSNGTPGGGVSIKIRGTNSITSGTQPLYIVDGIKMSSGNPTSYSTSANALSTINPADIESIDILKDAAAASIYGAEAANGVVLITTKRGSAGATTITINYSRGVTDRLKTIDVMNSQEWIQLYKEVIENYFGAGEADADMELWANTYGKGKIEDIPTVDWQKEVFRKGVTQDIQVSAQGGNEKTKFFLSGSLSKMEGQIIGTEFERKTLRSNIDHKYNKYLSFENSITLSKTSQYTVPGGGAYANPSRSAFLTVPFNPVYNPDGSYIPELPEGSYTHNVVMESKYNTTKSELYNLVENFNFTIDIMKGLKFKSTYGINYLGVDEKAFYDPRTIDGEADKGSIYQNSGKTVAFQTDQLFLYNTAIGKNNIDATLGFHYEDTEDNSFNANGKNIASYRFQTMAAAGIPAGVGGSSTISKLTSLFGRVNYNYNSRYYLSGTLRYDGSSRFGTSNKFGFFPAVSAAWRISDEAFFPQNIFIDDMKFRGSWGVMGNSNIGNFASRGLYGVGPFYNGNSGMAPSQLANPDLKWEQTSTYNIGMNLKMFNGRLDFSADYYKKFSSKLLQQKPLPITSGFSSVWQNIGKLENQGVEFELNTVNVKYDSFQWNTNFNISFNKNKITQLVDNQSEIKSIPLKVGEPIGVYYIYQWAGVNPADGRPMYYDANGEITYRYKSGDQIWTGHADPDYFGGLTNTFSYKGFELSVQFTYQVGGKSVNTEKQQFAARSGNTADRNQYKEVFTDRWQNPGDITWVPRPIYNYGYFGSPTNFSGYNTRGLESNDFIRLKQLNLSYNFPISIVKKLMLSNLQIYAQATNLWTKTNYTGYDPEFVGNDFGIYPQGKNITGGVKISF